MEAKQTAIWQCYGSGSYLLQTQPQQNEVVQSQPFDVFVLPKRHHAAIRRKFEIGDQI